MLKVVLRLYSSPSILMLTVHQNVRNVNCGLQYGQWRQPARTTNVRRSSKCDGFGIVQRWQIFLGVLRTLHAVIGIVPKLGLRFPSTTSRFIVLWSTTYRSTLHVKESEVMECLAIHNKQTDMRLEINRFWANDRHWIFIYRSTVVRMDRSSSVRNIHKSEVRMLEEPCLIFSCFFFCDLGHYSELYVERDEARNQQWRPTKQLG